MKISILALVFLLVLCFMLPCLFKKMEGFALQPSLLDVSGVAGFRLQPSLLDVSGVEGFAMPTSIQDISFSFVESFTDENTYSSYEKMVDNNLRNKGESISKYMRENPVDKTEPVKAEIQTNISVLDFFINLAKKSKESFTTTRILNDVSDNVTYDLYTNQELYNIDGTLKIGPHDTTDYAGLLAKQKEEYEKLMKDYIGLDKSYRENKYQDNYHGNDASMNSPDYEKLLRDFLASGDYSKDNSRDYSKDNSRDSKNSAKCIADFGTDIGQPLCCGQKGKLKNTKYVCPSNLPTCSGYVCGSKFGSCS